MELKISTSQTSEKKPAVRQSRICMECGKGMKKLKGMTKSGVEYTYFRCEGCGEEITGIEQLHEVAHKSMALKTYNAKVTQWGQSLGIRIPKELATRHSLTGNEEVTIIPEEGGFRIVPVQRTVTKKQD